MSRMCQLYNKLQWQCPPNGLVYGFNILFISASFLVNEQAAILRTHDLWSFANDRPVHRPAEWHLILIRTKFFCGQPAVLLYPGRTVIYTTRPVLVVGCAPKMRRRRRLAADSASPDSGRRKTDRPQVPVIRRPWLHASHDRAKRN